MSAFLLRPIKYLELVAPLPARLRSRKVLPRERLLTERRPRERRSDKELTYRPPRVDPGASGGPQLVVIQCSAEDEPLREVRHTMTNGLAMYDACVELTPSAAGSPRHCTSPVLNFASQQSTQVGADRGSSTACLLVRDSRRFAWPKLHFKMWKFDNYAGFSASDSRVYVKACFLLSQRKLVSCTTSRASA